MSEKKEITILAIESSCDETAAAVVRNGRTVLSNIISFQIDCTSCTEGWCRKLHPGNILRRSIR